MHIFLDDIRNPPEINPFTGRPYLPGYWTVVRTGNDVMNLLNSGQVVFISFDHDLGTNKTGYDVAKHIEELAAKNLIPRIDYVVHSQNVVGARNIESAMERAQSFWTAHNR